MAKKQEVAVHKANEIAPLEASAWGDEFVGTSDVVIPKILPMQGLSQLVIDEKARIGDFMDSVSGEKLGSISEPIQIIPFMVQKFWDIMEEDDEGNFKWVKSEPLIENPLEKGYNDNLPWSDKIDGVEVKRVRRMNFFCLIPKELAKGNDIPYILSFKSTSFREGKKLFTQMFVRNKKAGLAPCAFSFILAGVKQKNDKGTYVVPTLSMGPKATNEEVAKAFEWYKLIKGGGVKVDDSDLEREAQAVFSEEDTTGTGNF